MTTSNDSLPRLSAIVVHWRNEAELAELLAVWPRDERFELLVVDNSSSLGELPVRKIDPGRNLGFGGGANLGIRAARAPWVLLLNPDARPCSGALDALLEGIAVHPDTAGLAPRLEDPDGRSQHTWQLRPLPGVGTLLLQTLLVPAGRGPRRAPVAGAVVEQPAAAALLLRRSALAMVGGFDAGFFPAWFEDVDLARRLASAGLRLRYYPAARFRHGLGKSVPALGYGAFLWIYYRNLCRYLRRHHGLAAELLARLALLGGMLLRLAALPVRRPRRARTRREAAAGLLGVVAGAVTGWRRPTKLARAWAPGEAAGDER